MIRPLTPRAQQAVAALALLAAFAAAISTSALLQHCRSAHSLTSTPSPQPPVVAPWTSAAARDSESLQLQNDILLALSLPPDPAHSTAWRRGLHAMGLTRSAPDPTASRFATALTRQPPLPEPLLNSFLEITVALFPTQLTSSVQHVATTTKSPKSFAIAIHYLTRNNPYAARLWLPHITERFPDARSHPILSSILRQVESTASTSPPPPPPPLAELLHAPFAPGFPVIFSLQRHSRNWCGRAIVRLPDNSFARSPDGSLFSIPQLARSVSGLPGVITNGNTPQGLLAWHGFAISSNRFIGPTPNLQLSLPFEFPPRHFLLSSPDATSMTEDAYANLLPPSWRSWTPIWEAFHAGRAGRSEIIAHGTTIRPDWYATNPWHPVSPSHGCLTAMESWSPDNGTRTSSDQNDLVSLLRHHQLSDGYVMVVNISDDPFPVSPAEVTALLTP
jgi:hypothetical protein